MGVTRVGGFGGSGWRLEPGSGRVGWYYVCVCCESGLFVLMQGQVSVYCARRIPAHLRCTSVAPYRYLLPNLYLSVVYMANPDLFVCGSRTWIHPDIARFYDEPCMSGLPKTTVIGHPLLGMGVVDTICTGFARPL